MAHLHWYRINSHGPFALKNRFTTRGREKEAKEEGTGQTAPLARCYPPPSALSLPSSSLALFSPIPAPAAPVDRAPQRPRRPRDGGAGGYCRRPVARGRHGRPGAPAGCEGSPPRRRRARAGDGHGQVWYAPLEAKSAAVATFLDVSFACFISPVHWITGFLHFLSLDLHYA